jgi:N-methylhydantoinase B/oxoprolinase/acetone carboxylase alpha subunit
MTDAAPPYDPIRLEILRSRLMSLTAEAETALLKASFSTIISLSQDFTVEAHDARGYGLAHSRRSVSEFSAILPITMRHFLAKYPAETLEPGDVLVTNDPWQCAGHLGDFTIALPVFHRGRLVAFMSSMAHHSDVGGTMDDTGARDVFEEGLWIPITKLYRAGKPNEDVFDIIRANVRTPDKVTGDLHAQIAACQVGARQLRILMDEFGLEEYDTLAQALYDRAKQAMETAIAALPDGDYPYAVALDGVEEVPLRIEVVVKVRGAGIHVDYAGTSPQVPAGINSAWNFTFAETVNAIKSVLIPEIPSTEGCFAPITVSAPEASILNARPPAPVKGRTRTGFHIPSAIFGALAGAVPDKVQTPSGLGNIIAVNGEDATGTRFNAHYLIGAGLGARATLDGVNTLKFPTSSANVPIETFETQTPLVIERKEFVPDSGGLGKFRGGVGQRVVFRLPADFEGAATLSIRPQMIAAGAQGLAGGCPGHKTQMFLNGTLLSRTSEVVRRGSVRLEPGDQLMTIEAGGGGFGPPEERDPALIAADVAGGYVSAPSVARS